MNPFFGRSSGLMLALTLGVCSSFYIMQPALKQQRDEYQNSRDLTQSNVKKEETLRD